MSCPRLSVIIPAYENFSQLATLLSSLGDYVRDEVEVLVVDDASPNSDYMQEKILSLYPWVNYIINSENRGAGYSRNRGAKIAQGNWLIFADSDDYFEAGSIEFILSLVAQVEDEIDLILFPPKAVQAEGGLPSVRADRYREIFHCVDPKLREIKARIKWHAPWSKIVRKSLLVKYDIRFDEVPAANDVMFSLRAGVKARRLLFIDKHLYTVVERPNSLTRTYSYENLESRMRVILDYNMKILELDPCFHLFELPRKMPLRLARRLSMRTGLLMLEVARVYEKCIRAKLRTKILKVAHNGGR